MSHPPYPAPHGHQWHPTEDGSWSLYSEAFAEATHSRAGAWSETQVRYLEGCQLREQWRQNPKLRVLEVGFGTGLGLLALRQLYQEIKQIQPAAELFYLGLEIDPHLVDSFLQHHHALQLDLQQKQKLSQVWDFSFQRQEGGPLVRSQNNDRSLDVCLLVGDAKKTLPNWRNSHGDREGSFHAIFQDAFSPKTNPDLWNEDWFQLLRTLIHPQGTLSTFSAASKVKRSLLTGGWEIFEGPRFGPKRGSTCARPLK